MNSESKEFKCPKCKHITIYNMWYNPVCEKCGYHNHYKYWNGNRCMSMI